ncbi:TRAP transporter substrate-binding protein DctP [Belnapia sp. T6]|uniref:TRAP transporter substrate-binding protein DctP n=1 Tax=Belnapia mucosa TaxID=2804532 RepID=A0ABS1V2S2_9PROT|nr:TRAP transporter substrate-binding protein DctP [Belnapia mucosa]MBL6455968.1 TRAP transporter substrate-binding protein DctP [Belnapia mucosa]
MRILAFAVLALILAITPSLPLPGEEPPFPLKVVGFYTHAGMYADFEEPFWTRQVPMLTGGRVQPSIVPLDRAGVREADLLPLLRLGVLQVATVPLANAAGDDPELSIVDLPALNPDAATLRRSLAQWRGHLARVMEERYGLRLMALLIPTTQVLFCREPFARLADVMGRRVRVGSVAQGELVEAMGGTALVMPLPEVVAAMASRRIDCAVTGAMPGNRIGLHEVATHVSRLPMSWFVSAVAMNGAVWRSLPESAQQPLQRGLARLERHVMETAEAAIEDGFACNAGRSDCKDGRRGQMVVVAEEWDETLRRRLLDRVLLPRWLDRCGADCAAVWNRIAAPSQNLWAGCLTPAGSRSDRPC